MVIRKTIYTSQSQFYFLATFPFEQFCLLKLLSIIYSFWPIIKLFFIATFWSNYNTTLKYLLFTKVYKELNNNDYRRGENCCLNSNELDMIIIDDHVGLSFKAVLWIFQKVNATLVMITNNRPVHFKHFYCTKNCISTVCPIATKLLVWKHWTLLYFAETFKTVHRKRQPSFTPSNVLYLSYLCK